MTHGTMPRSPVPPLRNSCRRWPQPGRTQWGASCPAASLSILLLPEPVAAALARKDPRRRLIAPAPVLQWRPPLNRPARRRLPFLPRWSAARLLLRIHYLSPLSPYRPPPTPLQPASFFLPPKTAAPTQCPAAGTRP